MPNSRTTIELLDELETLETDADLIEHQLEMADNEGDYDENWYLKAKYAMKCKRRQAKHINRKLSLKGEAYVQ